MAKDFYTMGDRFAAVLIAIIFAVPTVFFIWFMINIEVASLGGLLSSSWLWGSLLLSVLLGFIAPNLFIDMLAAVWGLLLKLFKWLH